MQDAVHDRREMMTNQILMRGHATMKELLTASFGEWPPKGLDMNPGITHEQRVDVRPMLDSLKGSEEGSFFSRLMERLYLLGHVAGRADISGKRAIFINRFNGFISRILTSGYFVPSVVSTLGHEATHTLQGDHSYRIEEIFGMGGAPAAAGEKQSCPVSNNLMACLDDYEKEVAQRSCGLRDNFNKAADKTLAYLKLGTEVQALLHEIMIDGYQHWGRLPLNCNELWLALEGVGVKPPPKIRRRLQSLPKDSPAGVFGIGLSGTTKETALGIKIVNDSFSEEGQNMFWRETLPGIYADLLEMYGDKPGRARFFPEQKNQKCDLVQRP